ncbi:MAG: EF-hand domain-containing protein [Leptospiraceae bacterium]|nr:EF-hand domain-containing protein [Leptospiraceae bacterium]MCP5496897.1 EF-hand domain-containing protein [Leptospiraceae bacterium]
MKKIISILLVLAFATVLGAKDRGEKGQRFKKMDVNNDGKVSLEEWTNHKQTKFKKIDTNGDGTLSKEEVQAHHKNKKMRHHRKGKGDGKDPNKCFQEMDKNKDNKITSDEWLNHKKAKFKKIDTNGDNFLTKEEMKAHHKNKNK